MKILVIDSGVKISHPAFKNVNIESFELTPDGYTQVYEDNDRCGHGTAVCSLIVKSLQRQKVPVNIKVIKAFENETSEQSEIENALIIANKYFDVDIINLSFGITNEKVASIVHLCELLQTKSIVVSAADNRGTLSIPCSLPGVIGVVSDGTLINPYEFNYIDCSQIQMGAFGSKQRAAWIYPDYSIVYGNSYACANATGIIAGLLFKYGKSNIENKLKEGSKSEVLTVLDREKYSLSIPFEIKKAVIFPFSKETSSLVLFPELLDFEIEGIYDSSITGKVGSYASQILNMNLPCDYEIKNIMDLTLDNVDTVILGHLDEYLKYPREYKKILSLLDKCINNVAIYAFDPVENMEKWFSPIIGKNYRPPCINGGMLYSIQTPVIGIFGTSSKQGKFTLQLQLRKSFIDKGYRVGQIGTEPQSLLFGFDSVFSMGYNSGVELSGNDTILYLNRVIHEVEMNREIDIILTGCQSGTVPYSYENLSKMTLPQIDFVLGTCPDAVILCVNLYDEEVYVMRTIKFIESVADTRVVALVLYPKKSSALKIVGMRDDDMQAIIEKRRLELQANCGVPVFVLGQEIDELSDVLIDYLSE